MKIKLFTLLAFLVFPVVMQAQYNDMAAFGLKGKVKSCVVKNVDGKKMYEYTFSESGKILTIDGESFDSKYENVNRDAAGRLISATKVPDVSASLFGALWGFSNGETMIEEWVYNSKGLLEINRIKTDGKLSSGQKYSYTQQGVSNGLKFVSDGIMGTNIFTQFYRQHQIDSHGNWVKRAVYSLDKRENEIFDGYQTQEITYYSNTGKSNSANSADSTGGNYQKKYNDIKTVNMGNAVVSGRSISLSPYFTYISKEAADGVILHINTKAMVKGCNGDRISFCACFLENGSYLKDKNRGVDSRIHNYSTADGWVASDIVWIIDEDVAQLNDITITMPASELHLSDGWHTLTMLLQAHNLTNKLDAPSASVKKQFKVLISASRAITCQEIE